jgi:hypothetical protein
MRSSRIELYSSARHLIINGTILPWKFENVFFTLSKLIQNKNKSSLGSKEAQETNFECILKKKSCQN